jgi:hypothetical protein
VVRAKIVLLAAESVAKVDVEAGHRSRARADNRWPNEDFVYSGIVTPPRPRPLPHAGPDQRTSADDH